MPSTRSRSRRRAPTTPTRCGSAAPATSSPTAAAASTPTRPAEKGDDRNITQSVAAHDRSPAWSPDGKSIAWFCDDGGEYQLMIGAQDGKGTPRKIALSGAGFYAGTQWSPDSKMISFTDNSRTLFVGDGASGATTTVSQ